MSIHERIKAETVNYLLRRRAGPYELEIVPDATLDSAIALDKERRDWQGSLNHYYSVYENKNAAPVDQVRGLIGMSQMLINTGNIKAAEGWLERGNNELLQ